MPENGVARFFSSRSDGGRGYRFAFDKNFKSIDQVKEPEHYKHPKRTNICRTLKFGENYQKKRKWCFDESENENRVSVKAKNVEKAAVVFGGSFAFGDGVENDQTIASNLAKLGFDSYNFGKSGAGAHQFLTELYKNKSLLK